MVYAGAGLRLGDGKIHHDARQTHFFRGLGDLIADLFGPKRRRVLVAQVENDYLGDKRGNSSVANCGGRLNLNAR